MTITTEQAVALAEKHGAVRETDLSQQWDMPVWAAPEETFTAMLNDNEQQVIQRLAEQSGVMPEAAAWFAEYGGDVYAGDEVREALAKMQARVEQLERDAARYRMKRRIDHDKMIARLKTDDSELMAVASIGFNTSYDATIDAALKGQQ